jgi:Tfp pilus assembly protein PilO
LKARIAALEKLRDQEAFQPAPLERTNVRLRQITSLAAARGLEVNGVEPGAPRQESQYQAVPLRLTGTGGFRGCLQFLRDLHDSLRDTPVVAFRFTATPEDAGSPVRFDLELCWYAAPMVTAAVKD